MQIIPDIITEIMSHNKIYENFSLYSDENRIYYEVRESIIMGVLRPFVSEIIREYTNRMVTNYLNKRFADKHIDERDPLRRVNFDFISDVLRVEIRDMARDVINGLVQ